MRNNKIITLHNGEIDENKFITTANIIIYESRMRYNIAYNKTITKKAST